MMAASSAQAQAEPPPQFIPTDTHPPPSVRWKLVVGGLATTAGFYAVAQPFSYAWPDAPGSKDLRIPVAGPWIAIGNNGCADNDPDCSRFWVWTRGILTALDGLGQAGGLLIALEGVFVTTSDSQVAPATQPPRRTEGAPGEEPKSEPPPRNLFIAPTPMGVGDSGLGISVSGVF